MHNTLSWVDKVTTGTLIFALDIANVVVWFATVLDGITQFTDQVRIRHISKLNSTISKAL